MLLARGRALLTMVVLGTTSVAACSARGAISRSPSAKLAVVAAEGFWGSIAGQLGGTLAEVDSIVTNPNTDPHDYEPTPADARALASAELVIVNGIGYDPWAD